MTLPELINNEMNLNLPLTTPTTISSPFRNDSSPSFRVYGVDSNTGICKGAYDWGTGKSYNIISFLMELYGFDFKETLDYLDTQYQYKYNKQDFISNYHSTIIQSFLKSNPKYINILKLKDNEIIIDIIDHIHYTKLKG